MPLIAEEKATAINAVIQASKLCQQVRAQLQQDESMTKDDRSPVTVADFGAQAIVLYEIARKFPDDLVVAEEDASDLLKEEQTEIKKRVVQHVRSIKPELTEQTIIAAINRGNHTGGKQGRHWTLDPIDGTKGFLRNDQYAIALALIHQGEVILGVLGCPSLPVDASKPEGDLGCILVAEKGKGSQLLSLKGDFIRDVKVADITDSAQAAFCESVESGHSRQDQSVLIAEKLGITAPSIRMDSQCKYTTIARGDAAIYLRLPTRPGYEEKIWDHAAGAINVEEAGGKVTDIHGKALDFSIGRTLKENKGVVATNGHLHDAVIKAIADTL